MAWHDMAWPPFAKAPTPNQLDWVSHATLGTPSPAPPMPWVLFLQDPRVGHTITSQCCCPGDRASLVAPGHAQALNHQSSPLTLLEPGGPLAAMPQAPLPSGALLRDTHAMASRHGAALPCQTGAALYFWLAPGL